MLALRFIPYFVRLNGRVGGSNEFRKDVNVSLNGYTL